MRFSSISLYRTTGLVVAIWLAGCASNPPAPVVDLSVSETNPVATPVAYESSATTTYRVVRGDTLYAIAFKHGLDYRDLATWNAIAPPYRILVDQELRLSAPAPARAAPTPIASAPPAAPVAAAPSPGEAVTSAVPERAAVAGTNSAASQPSPFENVAAPAEPPPQPQSAAPPPKTVADIAPPPPRPVAVEPSAAPPPKPATPIAEIPDKTHQPAPEAPRAETARVESAPELSAGGVTWRWPGDGKVIAAYVSGDPTKQGIDISGKAGDTVHAAADGEVVYSGNGLIGYGELIIVKHNASFLSAYGHNRKRLVKEGDKVKAGQAIAEMGSATGARDELHFEIRKNGKPVNPLEYLPAR
jgi:lipoprotein NlpD